jgi:hypothetical protein
LESLGFIGSQQSPLVPLHDGIGDLSRVSRAMSVDDTFVQWHCVSLGDAIQLREASTLQLRSEVE